MVSSFHVAVSKSVFVCDKACLFGFTLQNTYKYKKKLKIKWHTSLIPDGPSLTQEIILAYL